MIVVTILPLQLDHFEEKLTDVKYFKGIIAGHYLYDEHTPFEAMRRLINKCVASRKRRPTMDEVNT